MHVRTRMHTHTHTHTHTLIHSQHLHTTTCTHNHAFTPCSYPYVPDARVIIAAMARLHERQQQEQQQ